MQSSHRDITMNHWHPCWHLTFTLPWNPSSSYEARPTWLLMSTVAHTSLREWLGNGVISIVFSKGSMTLSITGTVSSDDNGADAITDSIVGMKSLDVTLLLGERTTEQELECIFQVVIHILLAKDVFWVRHWILLCLHWWMRLLLWGACVVGGRNGCSCICFCMDYCRIFPGEWDRFGIWLAVWVRDYSNTQNMSKHSIWKAIWIDYQQNRVQRWYRND